MDVHYLPSNRHLKPAGEYVLELLIIFMAVILGFIANDFRESYVEKTKAKEYAQLLYNDMKADNASIQRTYNEKAWIESKYDSVETILATKDLREFNEFIYYVERYLSNTTIFSSRDITYQQMRNTGNSKYIKDINLFMKIANYYTLYDQYKAIETSYAGNFRSDLSVIESTLFNPRDLTGLDNNKATGFYNLAIRPTLPLKPIRRNIENLKLFYIKIDEAKKQANYTKLLLEKQKAAGLEIMKNLNKEYQLE